MFKIENLFISLDTTIQHALKIIDSGSSKIAIVVDDKKHFIGIITDGDIRRALISGSGISSPIDKIVNYQPITACIDDDKSLLAKIMKEKQILSIPILDGKRVVGLEILNSESLKNNKENIVFIMAGGFGKRLRPLTDRCPKPMLKIGSKTILERSIEQFKENGFKKFIISLHYLPDSIKDHFGNGEKFGVEIIYVYEKKPLGTGGALGLLDKFNLNLPIIMINGDILTKANFEKLLRFHEKSKAAATICVRDYQYQIPYGVINSQNGRIESIDEKPICKYFVNAGIYVLNPNLIKSVNRNTYLDMPTFLQGEIDKGSFLCKFLIHEYWIDIGQMHDYKRAESDIENFEEL